MATALLRISAPDQRRYPLVALAKQAVEPIEETPQQAVALLFGLEQQRGERGTQSQRVEGREDHRDRDGDCELLIQAAGDSGNENGRDENRRQHQRDTDHRTRNLFHRFQRGGLRVHALFDVALHRFHHDDRVVHHQADRQHKPEERQRVDGESEYREHDEGSDQRDRYRQQRDQRGAPALQKDVDHHRDQRRWRSR